MGFINSIFAWLGANDADSRKRAMTAITGFVVLTGVNPVLGLLHVPPVSDATVASAAGFLATYLYQSGKNSEADKQLEAAKVAAGATPASAPAVPFDPRPTPPVGP